MDVGGTMDRTTPDLIVFQLGEGEYGLVWIGKLYLAICKGE